MKRLLLTAAALALLTTAATACDDDTPLLFKIPLDVSQGHMNVRNGPGRNHSLVGTIPAGSLVTSNGCATRDDGVVGADWCFVTWGPTKGWVSRIGLMPFTPPANEGWPTQDQHNGQVY
jgi:uncharacterized protein YraI